MSSTSRGLFGFLRGDSRAASRQTAEPAPGEYNTPQAPLHSATGRSAVGNIPAQPAQSPAEPTIFHFPSSSSVWSEQRLAGDSDVKIVITGPFAAGKTAMVTTLGGPGAQVHTETQVSDGTAALKAFTTVSLDFASVQVPPPVGQDGVPAQVRLFGTPGQERFEFMWRVLATGMRGYVVLVDTSQQFSVDEAALILRKFRSMAPETPFVVGVSRWTGTGDPVKLARYLGVDTSLIVDLMREVDVREQAQSITLLQHLLAHIPTTTERLSA